MKDVRQLWYLHVSTILTSDNFDDVISLEFVNMDQGLGPIDEKGSPNKKKFKQFLETCLRALLQNQAVSIF